MQMCYCRRDSHERGSVEKCIAAPSWNKQRRTIEQQAARIEALKPAIEAARVLVAYLAPEGPADFGYELGQALLAIDAPEATQ